ncbi:MAG: TonB-dependent receptor [Myxococcota bacterium]|nr:TonB-dependent receptor [Myxococcota bacterium]
MRIALYATLVCALCALPITSALAETHAEPASGDEAKTDHGHTGHDPDHDHAGHEEHAHDDEIVVTITGRERHEFDVIQGTKVLKGDELNRAQSTNLGETVAGQTGVRSTGFAPGSGRPVIRGLDGPRVRTLQNGVGNIDVSVTSPDHQVVTEPLLAERIEILRGAGTLRYGSNAVGGLVNVIDGIIPESVPENGYQGVFQSTYGTNGNQRDVSGAVRLGTGNFAAQAQGSWRRSNDLEISGAPLLGDFEALNPDDPFAGKSGRVPNSDQRMVNGDFGASYVFEDGFVGVGYSRLKNDYGLPVAPEEEGGEDIRLDLESDRYHIGGEWRRPFGPFDRARVRGVYGDYKHAELEGSEVGTIFRNRGFEGRLELVQRPIGDLDGIVGFQFRNRDFEAVGEEAFVPATETNQFSFFAVEEIHLHPIRLEGGLRYEYTDHDVDTDLSDRSFHSFSTSLGASWEFAESSLIGLSLSRTERPPIAEELYSDGPHLATSTFELGDDGLDEEVAWGMEITAKHRGDRFRGALNLFATRFEDFIFQEDLGFEEDELPVRQFSATDAWFFGTELELAYDVYQGNDVTGTVDFAGDWVRGRELGGGSLPRIPPIRLRMGAEARSAMVDGRIEVEWVDTQDRTAEFERSTDSFTMLHASVTIRPVPSMPDLSLLIQGRNLTDERARNHISFLKERLPMAGRDVRIGVQWRF